MTPLDEARSASPRIAAALPPGPAPAPAAVASEGFGAEEVLQIYGRAARLAIEQGEVGGEIDAGGAGR